MAVYDALVDNCLCKPLSKSASIKEQLFSFQLVVLFYLLVRYCIPCRAGRISSLTSHSQFQRKHGGRNCKSVLVRGSTLLLTLCPCLQTDKKRLSKTRSKSGSRSLKQLLLRPPKFEDSELRRKYRSFTQQVEGDDATMSTVYVGNVRRVSSLLVEYSHLVSL